MSYVKRRGVNVLIAFDALVPAQGAWAPRSPPHSTPHPLTSISIPSLCLNKQNKMIGG